jgi:hypothetical protein
MMHAVSVQRVRDRRLSARALLLAALAPGACTVVPPDANTGRAPAKDPGAPFGENVCFQCTLRACSISTNACLRETQCAHWLDCVAECPTDKSGVAADGPCLRACGLPVSAEVLAGCVQDYSTGFLVGCEALCAPDERAAK